MAHETVSDKQDQRKPAAKAPEAKRPAKKKHAHHWRLLTMLVTIGVIVWFLPIIIAQTPLLAWGLKMATADLNGSVSVKSASLGWLSPIEIQGVEVKDKCGKPVLSVDSITGDRRLGAILLQLHESRQVHARRHEALGRAARRRQQRRGPAGEISRAETDNRRPPRPRSGWRSIFPTAPRRSPTNGPAWPARCGNCRSSSAWTPATDRCPPTCSPT